MRSAVTPEQVVALLNEALILDRDAISALVLGRVPCNERLAGHKTIVISSHRHGDPPSPDLPKGAKRAVGLMGILNGLFGPIKSGRKAGRGQISYAMDVDTRKLEYFFITEPGA
jgi:hypothetical protein